MTGVRRIPCQLRLMWAALNQRHFYVIKVHNPQGLSNSNTPRPNRTLAQIDHMAAEAVQPRVYQSGGDVSILLLYYNIWAGTVVVVRTSISRHILHRSILVCTGTGKLGIHGPHLYTRTYRCCLYVLVSLYYICHCTDWLPGIFWRDGCDGCEHALALATTARLDCAL